MALKKVLNMKIWLKILFCLVFGANQMIFTAGEYYRCPGLPLKYFWLKQAEKHCKNPIICYTALEEKPDLYENGVDNRAIIGHPSTDVVERCGQVHVLDYERIGVEDTGTNLQPYQKEAHSLEPKKIESD